MNTRSSRSGQPHQILDRPMILGAIHADMAHPRRRHQLQQPVRHADAGAQHRHDRELLAGDHRRVDLDERRGDAAGGHRQVAGDLVAHQQRDFAQQLAERARRGVPVAHVRQLVLDQRVIEDEKIGKTAVLGHGGGAGGGKRDRFGNRRRAARSGRGRPAGAPRAQVYRKSAARRYRRLQRPSTQSGTDSSRIGGNFPQAHGACVAPTQPRIDATTTEEQTMDMGIAGRTALVCAASKGLGRGCAEALAAEGVNLMIVARTAETLEATAAEIRKPKRRRSEDGGVRHHHARRPRRGARRLSAAGHPREQRGRPAAGRLPQLHARRLDPRARKQHAHADRADPRDHRLDDRARLSGGSSTSRVRR